MKLVPIPLAGAYLVNIEPVHDRRGSFTRIFDADAFAAAGLVTDYPQHAVAENSAPFVVRGLHYQADPFGEAKLIRCASGEIFDVIVDIRPESSTFGRWYGQRLSAREPVMLYVPQGFAHGYQSLTPTAEVHYLFSARYEPAACRGIHWNDSTLAISWPCLDAVVSDRDEQLPPFAAMARQTR